MSPVTTQDIEQLVQELVYDGLGVDPERLPLADAVEIVGKFVDAGRLSAFARVSLKALSELTPFTPPWRAEHAKAGDLAVTLGVELMNPSDSDPDYDQAMMWVQLAQAHYAAAGTPAKSPREQAYENLAAASMIPRSALDHPGARFWSGERWGPGYRFDPRGDYPTGAYSCQVRNCTWANVVYAAPMRAPTPLMLAGLRRRVSEHNAKEHGGGADLRLWP